MDVSESFEPRVLGLLCNWCSYAGADLTGTSRIQYPPNIRFIRVMCSGRVDPQMILQALGSGMDGVLVGGCHYGDCHYQSGNYKTARRIGLTKKLLCEMGVDERRLRFEMISASEGEKLACVVREFVDELKELGPNPLRDGDVDG